MRKPLSILVATLAVPVLALLPGAGAHADTPPDEMPRSIDGGAWPTSHVQGIAVDRQRGYVYWSFTQMLVKTDLEGNVLGTVTGLTGHLGDLDINPENGRVYGSLEYKSQEAFYIAIFDGDEIDRAGMDAEADGVMSTVYLKEVVDDFTADMDGDGDFDGDTANTLDHRYGSSGIDGVSFGPRLGRSNGANVLMVAYGIYSNTTRKDNDYQVLLGYDVSNWDRFERPLTQAEPHRSGPAQPDDKVFVRTGNTTWGVQNLSYDEHSDTWMMAVYKGQKPQFPNYSLFMIDGTVKPRREEILGQPSKETGDVAPLVPSGMHHEASGVWGYESLGSYGLEALGDGYFYIVTGGPVVEDGVRKQDATATLNRWTGTVPTPFEPVPAEG